ncbi:MAG TPA: ABC transporter permease [Bryobacteraceae bacterium]|jgi:predicted permease|nr:ABC transporter permease [Bryobacteraceae bacterium]
MFSFKILWRSLFRRGDVERELSEELRAYADLLTEEKISRGLGPVAARREALIEIGGIEQVKEQVREVRAGSVWESVLRDIEQSVRSLRRSMGTSLLAIGTFGLGLGATTLIFSVFYSVLLRPLPFRHPERLVQLWETRAGQGWDQASFSRSNFWDVREQSRTFESMAAMITSDMNMTSTGNPEHLSVGVVSAQFFHVLGVAPIIGHEFDPQQDQPGHNGVVLLSNKFWISHFASSRHILGTTLRLNGRAYTVIGALPKGEPWLDAAGVFVPLVRRADDYRANFEASVIGRLAPGVTIATAHEDLQRIAKNLSQEYREDRGMGIRVSPSASWGARPLLRRSLWVLLGAVTLLLLIACVNIANLLLAQATARSRELRVRQALGASRWRIVRLVLTESLMLGCFGSALGLLVADWGLRLIRTAELTGIPGVSEIGINWWVLSFTLLATLVSGIVSGLMPAIHSSSGDIAASLREGDRSQTAGRTQNRMRAALVTAEVALSVILLTGAGLLIRSFDKILTVDRGFETANRLIATANIPLDYDNARAASVTERLLERVRALPGVQGAGTVNSKPILGWDPGMGFGALDSLRSANGEVPWASWRFVSTAYFRAMGIRLLKGRRFDEEDYHSATRHVVVSEAVADLLWPGEDPIGRRIILWKGQGNRTAEVIGVVAGIRDHGLDADPTRIVYLAFIGLANSPVQLIIHTAAAPGPIASSLRSIMAAIDPKIPVSDVQTMDELVSRSLGSKALNTALLSGFALIALLLSITGIYGVLMYTVTRRTAEIGIRVALGANGKSIFGLIVSQGMRPIVAGIVIGIGGSLVVTRFLAGLLFEVKPADITSYLAVTLLIAVTALFACLLPARRALRVDPGTALRQA